MLLHKKKKLLFFHQYIFIVQLTMVVVFEEYISKIRVPKLYDLIFAFIQFFNVHM